MTQPMLDPFNYFLLGPAGAGKSILAAKFAHEAFTAGKPVLVVAVGPSYRDFCLAAGGTYVQIRPNNRVQVETFGQSPVLVIELVHLLVNAWAGPLPVPAAFSAVDFSAGIVVLDEVCHIKWMAPEVPSQLLQWVTAGAQFCLVGQAMEDFTGLPALPGRNLRLKLERV